ncbi:uncharacterized protein involved in type VI secretion and phage assembly [Natronocella acetinitrilica]|uniref:Uncharacterized protein involved in type VI secretion and phage assembly n=1 Tax=Natronocella acetinitrilica TaxID=414046 RepID=A0AAE3G6J6_9GAMM|nr:contractile injection system protein, VgrG/Pvc8 family [Natronocella acetinitrilica]MCP1676599.1 uncharacterized protein involved in type VI secretion and phage assembly [Natronocella acetinitrilica]
MPAIDARGTTTIVARVGDVPVTDIYALATAEVLSGLPLYRIDGTMARAFDASPWLGEIATITLTGPDGISRVLGGRVVEMLDREPVGTGRQRIVLWVEPGLTLLGLRQRTRILRDLSVPDLVGLVIAEHGGLDVRVRWSLRGDYPVRPWTVQAEESDLAFVTRLLARAGIQWCCGVDEHGEWLHCFDDPAAADVLDRGTVPVRPDSGQSDAALVHGALQSCRFFTDAEDGAYPIPQRAVRPDPKGRNRRNDPAWAPAGQPAVFGSPEADPFEYRPKGPLVPADHLRSSGSQRILDGALADLAPGRRLEIEGETHGYCIVQSALRVVLPHPHAGEPPSGLWVTAQGAPLSSSIRSEAAPQPERAMLIPARVEAHGRYAELDAAGRYRLRAGFDRARRAQADASPPLPRLTPHASPSRRGQPPAGWHFPLTDGAEVLLSCMNNDADQPYVVGYAPNAQAPGPVTSKNPSEHRILTPAGNALTLDDRRRAERITLNTLNGETILTMQAHPDNPMVRVAASLGGLQLQAGGNARWAAGATHQRRVGASETETVQGQHTTETKTGRLHRQAATGHSLRAAKGINAKAQGDIQLNSGQEMRLTANGDCRMRVTGDFTSRIENGNLILQAHGPLAIRGNGGGDMTVHQNGGGWTIKRDGSVRLFGHNVTFRSQQGVTFNGKLLFNVPGAHRPDEPVPAAPKAPAAVARITAPDEPGVTALRWGDRQLALESDVADTQLPTVFTVQQLETGEPVDVRVLRVLGQDSATLGEVTHSLDCGNGVETAYCPLSTLSRPGAAELVIAAGRPTEHLRFTVTARGQESAPSHDLALTRDLDIALLTNDGHPLEADVDLTLIDAGGRSHSAVVSNGEAQFQSVPIGRFQVHGTWESTGEGLAITRINGCDCPPGTAPWLRESDLGSIATELSITVLPPAILLSLRDEAANGKPALLPEHTIAAMQRNGNNATLFIHGYNVPLGAYGPGVLGVSAQSAGTDSAAACLGVGETVPVPMPVYRDAAALQRAYPDACPGLDRPEPGSAEARLPEDNQLNGSEAHGWLLTMEYQLNRAAGFDGIDHSKYTRIVGVTWSGDLGATRFWEGELSANLAGRRLLPVLQQLSEAGIQVNLISHSLGARVALTALNLRAELGAPPIRQLILWQPAVSQSSLAPAPADAPSLGHEHFPAAHRGVERILVLHSRRDGVLGASPRGQETGQASTFPVAQDDVTDESQRTRPSDAVVDPKDNVLGLAHGLYERKYWLNGSLRRWLMSRHPQVNPNNPGGSEADLRLFERLVWPQIEQEAKALNRIPAESLLTGQARLPDLLLPWAMHGRFDDELLAHIRANLHEGIRQNWLVGLPVEPALGWQWDEAAMRRHAPLGDMLDQGSLEEVDQTDVLFSHSGMRYPSRRLFEEIYRDRIMRALLDYSGFGGYR